MNIGLLEKIRAWLSDGVVRMHSNMSDKHYLSVVAIFVGSVAGFGAALMKDLINETTKLAKGIFPVDEVNCYFLILPLIGILLCGIFQRYLVKDNFEFGTQRILHNLKQNNYYLKSKVAWGPTIACALTIGFGGSAGSEGPIAYTGAGLGSNIGRFLKMEPDTVRILVIIGSAAGIAGIFKAPIGGMMFAIEVLAMPMTTVSVLALSFACLAAAFVAYAWSGFTIDVAFMPKNFFETQMTGGVILLGIFCGIYSFYYSYAMHRTEGFFDRLRNPWVKNCVSGILVGLTVFLFPVLYGEGYPVIGSIINGDNSQVMAHSYLYNLHWGPWTLIAFLAGTLLLKSIATAATNSGGGVGGDFAPTLFAGCMAGLFFAYFSNSILGTHLNVANFALFGMAGVMAGAIQAPLMAIFLTVEMVGDFAMFFPQTICALVAFATVRLLHRGQTQHFRPTWLHNIDRFITEKL